MLTPFTCRKQSLTQHVIAVTFLHICCTYTPGLSANLFSHLKHLNGVDVVNFEPIVFLAGQVKAAAIFVTQMDVCFRRKYIIASDWSKSEIKTNFIG